MGEGPLQKREGYSTGVWAEEKEARILYLARKDKDPTSGASMKEKKKGGGFQGKRGALCRPVGREKKKGGDSMPGTFPPKGYQERRIKTRT